MQNGIARSWHRSGVLALIIGLCQACTLTVPVDRPEPSTMRYATDGDQKAVVLALQDGLVPNPVRVSGHPGAPLG